MTKKKDSGHSQQDQQGWVRKEIPATKKGSRDGKFIKEDSDRPTIDRFDPPPRPDNKK